jgi:transaldolase
MNTTERLHDLGQSIWLDNITRELLQSGTLEKYISTFDVTGLTSNPTIYEQAIRDDPFYDKEIKRISGSALSSTDIFFELAVGDLTLAADLFEQVHQSTRGVDGWVSLEVSPLLANNASETVREAIRLHKKAARNNLFIKIPGTPAGLVAIEEAIFQGVPVNVTLLFSRGQYLKAASAYMRGIERRLEAGLDLKVASVASLFVSRWDVSVNSKVDTPLHNKLGIAIAQRANRAYQDLLSSLRWQRLAKAGAKPQRLLWASTGSKDPALSDTYYIQELATPGTINTMPEKTLLAFADHGLIGHSMSVDGDNAEEEVAMFRKAGIDIEVLAEQLQTEGTAAFTKSWNALLEMIGSKCASNDDTKTEPVRSTLHLKKAG